MRGTLLIAAALCAVLLPVAPASAGTGDFLQCDLDFQWLTVDGGSFSGSAAGGVCHHERSNLDLSAGAPVAATTSGTWSASSCGAGRLTGHVTVTMGVGTPIDVTFDVPTTGGAGTAEVRAADGEGGRGAGELALAETLTLAPCPRDIFPGQSVEVPGVIELNAGGVRREELPFLHVALSVAVN